MLDNLVTLPRLLQRMPNRDQAVIAKQKGVVVGNVLLQNRYSLICAGSGIFGQGHWTNQSDQLRDSLPLHGNTRDRKCGGIWWVSMYNRAHINPIAIETQVGV